MVALATVLSFVSQWQFRVQVVAIWDLPRNVGTIQRFFRIAQANIALNEANLSPNEGRIAHFEIGCTHYEADITYSKTARPPDFVSGCLKVLKAWHQLPIVLWASERLLCVARGPAPARPLLLYTVPYTGQPVFSIKYTTLATPPPLYSALHLPDPSYCKVHYTGRPAYFAVPWNLYWPVSHTYSLEEVNFETGLCLFGTIANRSPTNNAQE